MKKMIKKYRLPFKIIKMFPYNILVWIVIILFFGNLIIFMDNDDIKSKVLNLINSGYFYSFSISLILSCISWYWNDYLNKKRREVNDNFSEFKFVIFLLSFIGFVIMILLSMKFFSVPLNGDGIREETYPIVQILTYIFALFITFYIFLISFIEFPEVINDYRELEHKNIKSLKEASKNIDEDELLWNLNLLSLMIT